MARTRARIALVGLALGLAWALATLAAVSARPAGAAPLVDAVDAVTITVSDIERALIFYQDVLAFEKVSDVEVTGEGYERLLGVFGLRARVARLRLGEVHIEIMAVLTPRGRPIPADSRSNDRWFQHVAIVVADMDQAYAHLRRHRVRHTSPAPQRLPDWNPDAGGIEAFYFQDPDGKTLELLRFPAGKGDPRWQRASDELFLGIDHTAIVVADTGASLAFWQGALGLEVAGESENFGPEQERLNNVLGARLRITALRAAAGPGVELLEYLTPRGGRPLPADTSAADLWHWQINLAARDVAAAADHASQRLISPGPVALPDQALGFASGLLARDPDGHAVLFTAGGQAAAED